MVERANPFDLTVEEGPSVLKAMRLEAGLIEVMSRALVELGLDPQVRVLPRQSLEADTLYRELLVRADRAGVDRLHPGAAVIGDEYRVVPLSTPVFRYSRQVVELGNLRGDEYAKQVAILDHVKGAVDVWYAKTYDIEGAVTATPPPAAVPASG